MKKIILSLIVIFLVVAFFLIQDKYFKESIIDEKSQDVVLYIQDESMIDQTCAATKQKIITVSSEKNKYSEILEYLFETELQAYGEYDSFLIVDNQLKIMFASDMRPDNRPISSLSSCEIEHIQTVLSSTFTQFDDISSVALYSPAGVIDL